MTLPIEERVLSVLLDRDTMTLEEIRDELDHDSETPFVIEHFIRLGYVRRDKNTDSFSLSKAGKICISSVKNQHAQTP